MHHKPLEEWTALDFLVAETRKMDAEDVRTGKIKPEALYFIPREWASASKPVFPKKYQAS
jgi:hypothetical protein